MERYSNITPFLFGYDEGKLCVYSVASDRVIVSVAEGYTDYQVINNGILKVVKDSDGGKTVTLLDSYGTKIAEREVAVGDDFGMQKQTYYFLENGGVLDEFKAVVTIDGVESDGGRYALEKIDNLMYKLSDKKGYTPIERGLTFAVSDKLPTIGGSEGQSYKLTEDLLGNQVIVVFDSNGQVTAKTTIPSDMRFEALLSSASAMLRRDVELATGASEYSYVSEGIPLRVEYYVETT